MLHTALMVIHFFSAASIIALVLLQRGKGAEAGAGFGAGASGTVFGARGAGTALSRATAILAGVFMLTSLSLTYVGSHTKVAPNTVLDRMSQRAPAQTGSGGSAPASATPAPATTSQAPPNVAPSSVAPANPTPAAPAAPAPAGGTPASPAH
jgi:preprotein translocase subunit SecG